MNETQKLVIAKDILEMERSDLESAINILNELENKYFGKALEQQTAIWSKDVRMEKVKIEALEHFIWELENFLKMDADVSKAEDLAQEGVETTESKVSAELLNQ